MIRSADLVYKPSISINKYNVIAYLVILSLLNSYLHINIFGSSVSYYNIITIAFIAIFVGNLLKNSKYLWPLYIEIILLIITGIYFGIINPWGVIEGASWNRVGVGRASTATIKYALDLFLSFYVFMMLYKEKISIETIYSILANCVLITLAIGIVDLVLGNYISHFFASGGIDKPAMLDRFVALNHEPRSLGRLAAMAFMGLYIYKYYHKVGKRITLACYASLFIVIMTFSTSALFIVIGGVIAVNVVRSVNHSRRFIVAGVVLIVLSLNITRVIDMLPEDYMLKQKVAKVVLAEDYSSFNDGMEVFARFEGFDRAALNFFYYNPEYMLFGVGPNLVGVPASPYLDTRARQVFDKGTTAVPGTGLVRILSRSGLLGIALHLILFLILYWKAERPIVKEFLLMSFVCFMLVATPWFYFYLGLILYLIYIDRKSTGIRGAAYRSGAVSG